MLLVDFWSLGRLHLVGWGLLKWIPEQEGISTTGSAAASPKRPPVWLVREKLPLFALSLGSSAITYFAQEMGGAVPEGLPLHWRIANALLAYVVYISKTLWPVDLAPFYPYRYLLVGWVIAAILLLAALSGFCVFRMVRQPYLLVGWLWYLGTLVPAVGLIQVGSQSMADRYMYIPSIGLFMLVVFGFDELMGSRPHKRMILAGAGGIVLTGCLACTWIQLKYWRDDETLFRHTIEVTTDNYLAYDRLGNALDAAGRHDEALACFAKSVRLNPRNAVGQYDLGTALVKQGRLEEAVQHLTAALERDPRFTLAHVNLGGILLNQGKLEEARDHLSRAVSLSPDNPEAYYDLATLLLRQSKADEAIACFYQALKLNPGQAKQRTIFPRCCGSSRRLPSRITIWPWPWLTNRSQRRRFFMHKKPAIWPWPPDSQRLLPKPKNY